MTRNANNATTLQLYRTTPLTEDGAAVESKQNCKIVLWAAIHNSSVRKPRYAPVFSRDAAALPARYLPTHSSCSPRNTYAIKTEDEKAVTMTSKFTSIPSQATMSVRHHGSVRIICLSGCRILRQDTASVPLHSKSAA